MNNFKKGIVSLALAGSFIVGVGFVSNANAQGGRQRRAEQQQNNGQVDRNGNIDRNRNGIDDRYETNGQVDVNRNGVPDSQENGRYGRNRANNNGGYGNRGNDVNNARYQQGYRDGSNRGREDAQTNRAMTPNNSSHYRSGDQSYRAGFERGFYEAYRQNSGRGGRRW